MKKKVYLCMRRVVVFFFLFLNFVIFLFRHVINKFTHFKTIEHGKAKQNKKLSTSDTNTFLSVFPYLPQPDNKMSL